MPDTQTAAADHGAAANRIYDAIIIGAGIAGMYQLYRLREGISLVHPEFNGGHDAAEDIVVTALTFLMAD